MKVDFTIFFLVVFLAVYVAAIPGLLLVCLQLYRDATGWEQNRAGSGAIDMDEVSDIRLDRRTEIRRTVSYFGWFIGGALGIWLLGLTISLPILVFLYGLIEGRERWLTALIMGVCTYALVWGLFEYMLETRWPPGVLFEWQTFFAF